MRCYVTGGFWLDKEDDGEVSDRRCQNSIMLQKEADQRSDGIIRQCRSLYQQRVFYRTTDRPMSKQATTTDMRERLKTPPSAACACLSAGWACEHGGGWFTHHTWLYGPLPARPGTCHRCCSYSSALHSRRCELPEGGRPARARVTSAPPLPGQLPLRRGTSLQQTGSQCEDQWMTTLQTTQRNQSSSGRRAKPFITCHWPACARPRTLSPGNLASLQEPTHTSYTWHTQSLSTRQGIRT